MTIARKILAVLTAAERRSALVLCGLMVVGMVLETAGIGLIIPAIVLLMEGGLADQYPRLAPALAAIGNPSQMQLITGGMLVLVFVYFIKTLFLAFLTWRQMQYTYGVQATLSQRLFTTYLRQPYTFHLQRNSAQLIRNAISEVGQFTFSGILPALQLVTEGLVVLGIGGLLVSVEPLGTVISVLVLGSTSWLFTRSTRNHVTRWGVARQFHEGLRIQHLQQGLGGAKDVKLLGRESDFLSQYAVHNTKSARVGYLQATMQQIPRLWLELLAVIGTAMLVLLMVAQGKDMTTVVPTLGLFAAAAFRLMPSVNRVISALQSVQYGLPVINTLYDELSLPAPEPSRRSKSGSQHPSRIELSNIEYAYDATRAPAISGLTLSIRGGESVGFVGPSGSGKSTLVDIILGLLTPSKGSVRVGGQDIEYDLRAWQDQIGYVPQSIFLTDDTLRRNVAFGLADEQIDERAVLRAIEAAQVQQFVASLPEGLDTVVGERGVRLSGGQRQRIGIARALYHDPSVLVLDEATSALDGEGEREVMRAVRALQGTKTLLIVAHRLTTVEHCDCIYRLENGKLVGEGVPGKLVSTMKVAEVQ